MSHNPGSKKSGPGNQPPKGPNKGPGMKPPQIPGKTAGFWILLVFLVFLVYQMVYIDRSAIHELTYSAFEQQVTQGNMRSISKTGLDVNGELNEKMTLTVKDGSLKEVDRFHTRLLSDRDDFAEWISASNPEASLIGEPQKTNWWAHFLTYYLPFLLILGLVAVLPAPDAGRRQQGLQLRQEQGQDVQHGQAGHHLRGRGRLRRGQVRTAGDHRLPARAPEVPAPGRPHSQGRAAGGLARVPARPCSAGPWPAKPGCLSSA